MATVGSIALRLRLRIEAGIVDGVLTDVGHADIDMPLPVRLARSEEQESPVRP
ncbi:hypothetical protein [Microbacterium sp. NIBRBAC000506063]|uniref:hypothetical protein n=1 Tax=Microbacterium sp. NIBRBAC000506063 TaxID=2734618 RepID=UPI001BB721D5|nr:hypothetical protein [Microbacterium sp. NIBRBAC000506063]QTV79473.1 hypothetical protein KAE78_11255 [Microbacterium sp. NIBRBAC000506063]